CEQGVHISITRNSEAASLAIPVFDHKRINASRTTLHSAHGSTLPRIENFGAFRAELKAQPVWLDAHRHGFNHSFGLRQVRNLQYAHEHREEASARHNPMTNHDSGNDEQGA